MIRTISRNPWAWGTAILLGSMATWFAGYSSLEGAANTQAVIGPSIAMPLPIKVGEGSLAPY